MSDPNASKPTTVVASMDGEKNTTVDDIKVSDEVTNHQFAGTNFIIDSTDAQRADRRAKAVLLKAHFETDDALSALIEALPQEEQDVFWTVDTCERYLIARDMKEKKAEEMLIKSLKWRAEQRPWDIKFEEVKECMEAGSVYISGRCKAGRPIFYLSVGAVNAYPAEMRIKLITYLMEESFRRGHQQLTWIFNFARLGENKGTDPEAKKTRKMMMAMCQDHYPERLGALHLLNTPWYINMLATLVWPFLEVNTRKKINLKCTAEDLLKYVDKEELSDTFGGSKKRSATPFPDNA